MFRNIICVIVIEVLIRNTAHAAGACQRELDASKGTVGGQPIVGVNTPDCDANGNYKAKQCHPSTGYCWCADPETGTQIGEQVRQWEKELNCNQSGTSNSSTTNQQQSNNNQLPSSSTGLCQQQYNQKMSSTNGLPPPGTDMPQCDANGNFQSKQCSGSTGYCWCVNPTTGERLNEETRDSVLQCGGGEGGSALGGQKSNLSIDKSTIRPDSSAVSLIRSSLYSMLMAIALFCFRCV